MNRIFLLALICVLLIVGCEPATPIATATVAPNPSQTPSPTRTHLPTRTPVASVTPLPSFTPTLMDTPQPTLIPHEWKPNPVLITYSQDSFGFCADICPPDSSPFILYGDGTLIIHGPYNPDNGEWHYLYKKLNQSEVCRILNTIDQTGFFDFDPSTYSTSGVTDSGNWRVEVYAWRNKDISLYGLGDEVNFLNQDPSLSPSDTIKPSSVRNTFTLLYNFPLTGLDVYIPKLLGVWIWKSSFGLPRTKTWTVDNISLAKLYKKAGSLVDALPRPIYLDGKDAENIYAMFDNSNYYGEVTQNGVGYGVYVRPVLPFEQISRDKSALVPDAKQIKLLPSLQCSPADGTMPIPPYGPK